MFKIGLEESAEASYIASEEDSLKTAAATRGEKSQGLAAMSCLATLYVLYGGLLWILY